MVAHVSMIGGCRWWIRRTKLVGACCLAAQTRSAAMGTHCLLPFPQRLWEKIFSPPYDSLYNIWSLLCLSIWIFSAAKQNMPLPSALESTVLQKTAIEKAQWDIYFVPHSSFFSILFCLISCSASRGRLKVRCLKKAVVIPVPCLSVAISDAYCKPPAHSRGWRQEGPGDFNLARFLWCICCESVILIPTSSLSWRQDSKLLCSHWLTWPHRPINVVHYGTNPYACK